MLRTETSGFTSKIFHMVYVSVVPFATGNAHYVREDIRSCILTNALATSKHVYLWTCVLVVVTQGRGNIRHYCVQCANLAIWKHLVQSVRKCPASLFLYHPNRKINNNQHYAHFYCLSIDTKAHDISPELYQDGMTLDKLTHACIVDSTVSFYCSYRILPRLHIDMSVPRLIRRRP